MNSWKELGDYQMTDENSKTTEMNGFIMMEKSILTTLKITLTSSL